MVRKINPGWLAGQPAVPRVTRGMVYLARGAEQEAELDALLAMAAENGLTEDVRRIEVAELQQLEPHLNTVGVTAALLSYKEFIVDPWLLGRFGKLLYCTHSRIIRAEDDFTNTGN
jgi:L-2-hydroxyglutarate oxidase LhgO